MSLVRSIFILLCTCMMAVQMHAQENSDLKGTACVPVRTVAEKEMAINVLKLIFSYNDREI